MPAVKTHEIHQMLYLRTSAYSWRQELPTWHVALRMRTFLHVRHLLERNVSRSLSRTNHYTFSCTKFLLLSSSSDTNPTELDCNWSRDTDLTSLRNDRSSDPDTFRIRWKKTVKMASNETLQKYWKWGLKIKPQNGGGKGKLSLYLRQFGQRLKRQKREMVSYL